MLSLVNNDIFSDVFAALDSGSSPVLATGLGAAARAHLASCLKTESPLFIICADDTSAEGMKRDIDSLLGCDAALLTGRDPVLIPADTVSRIPEQQRIAALSAITGGAEVTVASARGLLLRTMPPEIMRKVSVTVTDGSSIDPKELEMALLKCGYVSRLKVDAPGQFSRRGGILDIFSPAQSEPVRIEFWGDDIDSMSFFDLESQRRTSSCPSVTILPAGEALPEMYPGGAAAFADVLEKEAVRAMRRKQGGGLASKLRQDAEKLRSGLALQDADRYMALLFPDFFCGADYIPEDAFIFISEPSKCLRLIAETLKLMKEDIKELIAADVLIPDKVTYMPAWDEFAEKLQEYPVVMGDNFIQGRCSPEPKALFSLTAKQLPSYGGSLDQAAEDVKHYIASGFSVLVLAADERRRDLLSDFFAERGTECLKGAGPDCSLTEGRCTVAAGALSGGVEYPNSRLAIITDTQIMKSGTKTRKKKHAKNTRSVSVITELSVGDVVVHETHGIGRFQGIVRRKGDDGSEKDYIKIEYAGNDVLLVPATALDRITKYIGGSGGEDKPVRLSKMGGGDWERTKTRAKAAAREMAGELIKLYAERKRLPGHSFAPDSVWQTEFETSFEYNETDDQLRAIEEIKKDMEASSPMDRLLCGDVGYGKTEVAMRAVMKCVLDGYQAAILVPTTVLAQQHYQTAMQRFFGYPVTIELMNRSRTPQQIKKVKEGLKGGSVDIVIGTHSLLQKSVEFKKLGLLVIDEEQRFGVSHKERLKEMSKGVDVLTLSATPIPRTLNMAMSGLRDMSTLEEPPQDRHPVSTFVMEYNPKVIADACRRELARGGQVYWLHNKIDTIERQASRIREMLPDVSVATAHGRMDPAYLAQIMESMGAGEIQVLVCTTIIETGIDMPNVNLLIIEDADSFGLAQLHQLRGRVGRSGRTSAAYLTYRPGKVLTEIAEKRLSALREFARFNAGFRIAMRDLEIRGAGNMLGAEQSGHMIDVGYDMYLQLLEEAVLEEQGKKPEVKADCSADLAVSANIPELYIPSPEQRMDLYRRIAMIRTEEDADDLTDELIDRFGDPPSAVNSLIHVSLLRGEATRAGISAVNQRAGALRFTLVEFDMAKVSAIYPLPQFKGRFRVEPGKEPVVSLRLKPGERVIEAARSFVKAWGEAPTA